MASASASTRAFDDNIHRLVELGEKNLEEERAEHMHKLRSDAIVIKKINLGMTELSHLHSQLNSITTQATLIVGFAVASLSADTLAELASDTGQFCIYKSGAARLAMPPSCSTSHTHARAPCHATPVLLSPHTHAHTNTQTLARSLPFLAVLARCIGALFVNVAVFCIFSCYTVITCATAITAQASARTLRLAGLERKGSGWVLAGC